MFIAVHFNTIEILPAVVAVEAVEAVEGVAARPAVEAIEEVTDDNGLVTIQGVDAAPAVEAVAPVAAVEAVEARDAVTELVYADRVSAGVNVDYIAKCLKRGDTIEFYKLSAVPGSVTLEPVVLGATEEVVTNKATLTVGDEVVGEVVG